MSAHNGEPTGPDLWDLGVPPTLATPLPRRMQALTLHRDRYGPPAQVLACEPVALPTLGPADADKVLVAVLASGPNFNTNFAVLGLPVPVFGRGDTATVHIPGSDALGLVVDAGPAVDQVSVGQAVILDSWTGGTIRGYETHDGFNAQFALVEQHRAIPVPPGLDEDSPEQLAAMLLTYGTAYRAVVERLDVQPGQSILIMGGGKGTSFAGAQMAKALGARVILVGSNQALGDALIERGVADAFVNRRLLPAEVHGVLAPDQDHQRWWERTEPFRRAVFEANDGSPVDGVFEHTGGENFPLLASVLAEGGALAFFGATGRGLKGEYKETFFVGGQRRVLDARWVWMRQKQVLYRTAPADRILAEIGLLPGRRGLIWGADAHAREFARAALDRQADLAVLASRSSEADGIAQLVDDGVEPDRIIDLDRFTLDDDMPDPLLDDGTPNPEYNDEFQATARALGRAVWAVFGPRTNPDFVVDRPDRSTLHYSTFLARDFDENDAMPTGFVVSRADVDLDVLGSHMYHDSQAREVVRLLADRRIVLEQDDLDIVGLAELPGIQQKMLDGTMTRPKGVALVQADRPGRSIAAYQDQFLGRTVQVSDPADGRFVDVRLLDGVALVTLDRPDALNALSEELLTQLGAVVSEVGTTGQLGGQEVRAMILRGGGRAFVAGADIAVFMDKDAAALEKLANDNMAVFTAIERLALPVVSLIDGFALGGGNELAMATHHRIVTGNAALGQPEVKLGIIPGYGGMQRLPRLVGPRRAAELSVNGESISAAEAVAIGLADEHQPAGTALRRAFQAAVELADAGAVAAPDWSARADAYRPELEQLLADPTVTSLLSAPAPDAAGAADLVAARRYAARVAIEALRDGWDLGIDAGLANDARLFGQVVASPSGQYWAGRFLAKDPAQQTFLTQLG